MSSYDKYTEMYEEEWEGLTPRDSDQLVTINRALSAQGSKVRQLLQALETEKAWTESLSNQVAALYIWLFLLTCAVGWALFG